MTHDLAEVQANIDGLLADFEQTKNVDLFGLIADQMEDIGRTEVADALRWLVENRKWPEGRWRDIGDLPDARRLIPEWVWYCSCACCDAFQPHLHAHAIPRQLFGNARIHASRSLCDSDWPGGVDSAHRKYGMVFPSLKEAINAALGALQKEARG